MIKNMTVKVFATGSDSRRVCRHYSEGRTDIPKHCLCGHECHHCGFDQWLEAMAHAAIQSHEAGAEVVCRLIRPR